MGLEAIAEHNGWSIALLGICIVFTGLAVLSFSISRLHKLLNLWDNRHGAIRRIRKGFVSSRNQGPRIMVERSAESLEETVRQYHMLVGTLTDPFALPDLLNLAKKRGLYHPYSTVNDLIKRGYIQPDQKGFFYWKQQTLTKK